MTHLGVFSYLKRIFNKSITFALKQLIPVFCWSFRLVHASSLWYNGIWRAQPMPIPTWVLFALGQYKHIVYQSAPLCFVVHCGTALFIYFLPFLAMQFVFQRQIWSESLIWLNLFSIFLIVLICMHDRELQKPAIAWFPLFFYADHCVNLPLKQLLLGDTAPL